MKKIAKNASNRIGLWLASGMAFGVALGIVGKQLLFWASVGALVGLGLEVLARLDNEA